MIRTFGTAPALGLALSFLSGCCWNALSRQPETLVIVVPSRHDGHVGSVVVGEGEQRQVLDQAYASVRVRGHTRNTPRPTALTAEEVRKIFAQASEALPRQPQSFTLYFGLATEDLTPASNRMLDELLAEVAKRSAAEIVVVGHTDRMGTPENNDALSLKRAEVIRKLVIRRGAAAEIVHAVGLGEREPVVDTDDGVAEARNRRVEIIVR